MEVPPSFPDSIRPKTREQIKQSLDKQFVHDYEPNILDQEDVERLISVIEERIDHADESRKLLLKELRGYIQITGALFPEFSHGTSSDALEDIYNVGLYSKRIAKALYHNSYEDAQDLGEGVRGGGAEGESATISAAAGQGGLGTALAYAQAYDNPEWNPNLLSETELQKVNEYASGERLAAHCTALSRKKKGIHPDFPLVVGFDRSLKVASVEEIPRGQWIYRNSTLPTSIKGFNHEFDSEIMLGTTSDPDQVPPLYISTISCPRARVPEVLERIRKVEQANREDVLRRANLQGYEPEFNERNIEVISIEALEELGNLGFPRINLAKNASTQRIQVNLSDMKTKEILAKLMGI